MLAPDPDGVYRSTIEIPSDGTIFTNPCAEIGIGITDITTGTVILDSSPSGFYTDTVSAGLFSTDLSEAGILSPPAETVVDLSE